MTFGGNGGFSRVLWVGGVGQNDPPLGQLSRPKLGNKGPSRAAAIRCSETAW